MFVGWGGDMWDCRPRLSQLGSCHVPPPCPLLCRQVYVNLGITQEAEGLLMSACDYYKQVAGLGRGAAVGAGDAAADSCFSIPPSHPIPPHPTPPHPTPPHPTPSVASEIPLKTEKPACPTGKLSA